MDKESAIENIEKYKPKVATVVGVTDTIMALFSKKNEDAVISFQEKSTSKNT